MENMSELGKNLSDFLFDLCLDESFKVRYNDSAIHVYHSSSNMDIPQYFRNRKSSFIQMSYSYDWDSEERKYISRLELGSVGERSAFSKMFYRRYSEVRKKKGYSFYTSAESGVKAFQEIIGSLAQEIQNRLDKNDINETADVVLDLAYLTEQNGLSRVFWRSYYGYLGCGFTPEEIIKFKETGITFVEARQLASIPDAWVQELLF